ncbi:Lrp/AsnC family transcriptional regulator [Streptomyces sp. S1D4-11]|nr:winged helix-turn-helix transcriptional regulator [Streptomyces sp. S1D4-11]QIZ00200.1 winged helix-turn-helix transcriptional regulator [Streptomyces sp. S1D4-11]
MRVLQEDGRRTNRDTAQEPGIAPSTCLERIRSLRRSGILTGFHAEADLAAIGRGTGQLTKPPELADVRTSVVHGHMLKKVIGPT